MRRTEAQASTEKGVPFKGVDVLPSGIEGYVAHMKRYPVLSREQTEVALSALQSGTSLDGLREHALFKPHLEKERQALLDPKNYYASPIRSYHQLFADSPTIGNLVAFGNFPTVLYWVEQFRTTYNGLPLALEEFMQDALFKIVPEEARRYVPTQGASFTSYISNMLIWRLDGLVDKCITQRSMLPRGAHKRELKPKHDSRRLYIESLDAPLPEGNDNGEPSSLYDVVVDERASMPGESLARGSAIRRLYEVAGITRKEAQVLQTDVIEGESQGYAASLYGVNVRTIRGRRDEAVTKFRQLGKERVAGILNGDGDGKLTQVENGVSITGE